MEFTTYEGWMKWATTELGLSGQEAYQRYRKAWWMIQRGKPWNRRRLGVKSKRTRYRDASTATEETAS
tara:strand:- start:220 stop:423 length:204 start_codon:yes stop_codon:yes gene_type:complete